MTEVQNIDGQGQLLIGERLSPASYHLAVERSGKGYAVTVEMQAPRDWLIRQGFQSRATLVVQSGDRIEVAHDGPVDVSDNISVLLQAKTLEFGDRSALLTAFPEAESGLN